jgi:small conductance mechanosensitive channel
MASLTSTLAQTTTTTVPAGVEVVEPSRPITEFFVDLFGLDPDGTAARIMSSILEPLLQVVLILALAWIFLRLVRRLGIRFVEGAKGRLPASTYGDSVGVDRRNQRVEALSALLNSVLGLVVWISAFLVILGTTFGINLTPFLAGAGVIGIALGFGAQDLVKDFLSGVFMLIEDQYGVGDVIDVGDATGTVERISLRSTRIRDVTGTVWHFPNGEIRRVGNLSQEWSRVLLDIGVAYGSDIDRASAVIQSVADEMAVEDQYKRLFLAPPEVLGVESVGPEGVVIRLVIKTLPGEQSAISREVRRRVKLALDSAGIDVPLAQRSLWLRQDDRRPAAESE